MQTETFKVDNVKCAGCASNIETNLAAINGVDKVDVEIESGIVTVSGSSLDASALASRLAEIGYPQA